MCGGELIYSEGTHDLCCARNPYESMSGEEWEANAALHEGHAGYGEGAGEGDGGRLYIYKVWNEGEEGGRLKRKIVREGAQIFGEMLNTSPPSSPVSGIPQMNRSLINSAASSGEATDSSLARNRPLKGEGIRKAGDADSTAQVSAGEGNQANPPATPVKGHVKEIAVQNRIAEIYSGENDQVNPSDTPVKTHRCVFAVSFTESGRFGTLWSMRTVHAETNYFSLTRLMQKIEKRLRNREPLAANSPNPPKKRERSAAAKLAFRFGIEEEDVYSIRYSTETVKRLAVFYGIPERDVRRIRKAEGVEE
jgi:hypothetical protein